MRRLRSAMIPLVSAIGHETDWTLIDHVADIRAPTPTAAAELSVPVRSELLARLADLDGRGRSAILRLGRRRRGDLRAAKADMDAAHKMDPEVEARFAKWGVRGSDVPDAQDVSAH